MSPVIKERAPQPTENKGGFSTSSQRIRHVKSKVVARWFVIIGNDLWTMRSKGEKKKAVVLIAE